FGEALDVAAHRLHGDVQALRQPFDRHGAARPHLVEQALLARVGGPDFAALRGHGCLLGDVVAVLHIVAPGPCKSKPARHPGNAADTMAPCPSPTSTPSPLRTTRMHPGGMRPLAQATCSAMSW